MKTQSSNNTVAPKHPPHKINWKYECQQYGAALLAAVILYALLSLYHFWRGGDYDLFSANRVLADASTVLLGLVLLLGPGSRLFSFPDRFVQYRKELGIIAFFLALFHFLLSFFFLQSRFPFSYYLGELNWPFIFGLLGIILLIIIFAISNKWAMKKIGAQRWWKWQYWGARITFILVALHVFIMKWESWVQWYRTGEARHVLHPELPSPGLLIAWFMVLVIIIRLAEFINKQLARIVWYIGFIALVIIYITTFYLGYTHG